MWAKYQGGWQQVRYTDASGFLNGYQTWLKRDGEWWANSFIFETKDVGWFVKWEEDASPNDKVWVQVLPPPGEVQPSFLADGNRFDVYFERPQRGLPPRLDQGLELFRQLGWTAGILRIEPPGIRITVWAPPGFSGHQVRAAILGVIDPSWTLTVSSV